MKHNIPVFILTILIAGCLTYGKISLRPGIYEGESRGYRGQVRVMVSISENGMEDIEILENHEDIYAAEAMEELRELALESGSADLDTVSGATVSSAAFLKALENALAKAEIH